MMKLLALILIFAACCLGGYCLAAPYKRRPLLRNQLHSGILGLENRLIYYGEPLHLALVHLGAGHDDAVSCLFYGMGKSMEKDPRLSPRQAAEQELNAPNYASLTAMDREILLEIFEGMGRDQQGQKSLCQILIGFLLLLTVESDGIENGLEDRIHEDKMFLDFQNWFDIS